jgi:hypothetical protein
VVGTTVEVGYTAPGSGDLYATSAAGTLSATYHVSTGTVGPPCGPEALATCPSTDSTGGNPATDAGGLPLSAHTDPVFRRVLSLDGPAITVAFIVVTG